MHKNIKVITQGYYVAAAMLICFARLLELSRKKSDIIFQKKKVNLGGVNIIGKMTVIT